MVRVAHISDSHLGAAMFQLPERREDVRICFRRAVERALSYSPDILVHTGDLFDSPDPSQVDMQVAIEAFKAAAKKDVMVVVLQGNHDLAGLRRTASPVRTLEQAEYVVSTGEEQYRIVREKIDGQDVEMHLLSWGPKRTTQRLVRESRPDGDINLLFAHTTATNWDSLPLDFDYIGEGHTHVFRLDQYGGIGAPGSTAVIEWRRELGKNRTRQLIVVDAERDGIEFQTEELRDVREFVHVYGLDITGTSGEMANEVIKRKIETLPVRSNGSIVIIEVSGTIDSEAESAIKREELVEFGRKHLNALVVFIEPKWNVLGPRPVSLSKPLDVRESVTEYALQTGMDQVEEMIQLLEEIGVG
ncbi:MAG: metallophosphoesterase family protein [Candidatus Thorarchaeota archaeon]